MAMPASRSAISSPMLLITVATTALPFSRPSALRPLAHISITASPSTIAPDASTKMARSPSPSNAMPISKPPPTTTSARPSGWVEPQLQVDVAPVGLDAEERRVESEVLEDLRRHRRGRAVGAVHRDPHAAPAQPAPAESRPRWRSYSCAVIHRRAPRRARPDAVHDESAITASTCRSSASVNFSPAPENTLMPLSSNGLCDAEMTTPAVKPWRGVR